MKQLTSKIQTIHNKYSHGLTDDRNNGSLIYIQTTASGIRMYITTEKQDFITARKFIRMFQGHVSGMDIMRKVICLI